MNVPSSGISNKLQAVILTISIFLVALPTIASPDTFSPLTKWIIMLAGLVGVALKEGLGSKT